MKEKTMTRQIEALVAKLQYAEVCKPVCSPDSDFCYGLTWAAATVMAGKALVAWPSIAAATGLK